ncbi:MAG: carbohydrate ABC transporter permease [Bacillales bacterium]|jgi:multiple sugar transport system permease protein|nr:carbohydrate ABC transporter permease [Bacillales bacterium]
MNKKVKNIIFSFIAILVIIISLFPLFWMFISGFKAKTEIIATPFKFFPDTWDLSNYLGLLTGKTNSIFFPRGANFLTSMGLTLLISLVAVVLSILINSLAAYAFARLDFPFKKTAWLYYLITMFIPSISILISATQVTKFLGLTNTLPALILPGVVYVWSIFFYRQFFLNIPRSLEEAALIDGCNRLQIFFKIYVPMSGTPFVIMGISVFQGFWNAFIWPTIVMKNPQFMQVNQLIAYFRSSQGIEWHMLMASSALASIPLIVLLIIFQKKIMEGIRISGMK